MKIILYSRSKYAKGKKKLVAILLRNLQVEASYETHNKKMATMVQRNLTWRMRGASGIRSSPTL